MKTAVKNRLEAGISLLALTLILTLTLLSLQYDKHSDMPAIRIGIIHSLTGTMAKSEKPLVDILHMAVDEINADGGLLGRRLETVIVDGRSDTAYSAKAAERLIVEEKVDVIFGCWTSSCRKALKPIVEKHNHLLFYPVQYEGLEQSPNIIYTGAAPNQQIIPGVIWALNNLGRRVYLLGSDYIFPHTANFIIRDIARVKNASIVAERYRPLGSDDFEKVIEEIKKLKPDVILNTINGDSNQHFFFQKHEAGLDGIPVLSFSVTEAELLAMPSASIDSHYAAQSYFQSIDSPVNKEFVERIKQKFGNRQVIGDPMEASYIGFKLWAQAVRSAGSIDPGMVLKTIKEQTLNAPEGVVSVDRSNKHLRKNVRVGRAKVNGQFDIVWKLDHAVRPVPFPSYRSRAEWQTICKQIEARVKQ